MSRDLVDQRHAMGTPKVQMLPIDFNPDLLEMGECGVIRGMLVARHGSLRTSII